MRLLSRKEAKELRLTRYFTGASCAHGHTAERMVSNRRCAICVQNDAREWGRKNPEKKNALNLKWQAANPERAAEVRRKSLANFAAKSREISKQWRRDNLEIANARVSAWRRENPERARIIDVARAARYRAKKREATTQKVSPADIAAILKRQKYKCSWCGASIKEKWHIDHVMPLTLGGEHGVSNLVASCPSCNCRKSGKHPVAWAQEIGLLL